jgi:indolepyruvate ferredoxin oxidoreductase
MLTTPIQGPLTRSLLKILRSMKSLRGTRLDVFGYAHVRIEERALIEHYLSTMSVAAARLEESTASLVREKAELPDNVRGYEDVKLRSLRRYQVRRDELMHALETAVESVHP